LIVSSGSAAVPSGLIDTAMSLTRSDAAAGVSSIVLTLARGATEVSMTRWKLLAAVVMIGTGLSFGVGGRSSRNPWPRTTWNG